MDDATALGCVAAAAARARAATDREQGEEVRRLLGLGARHADVGQGKASWVVLADPEGNEFCVLASRFP